jgi:putative hydrolase of the HAD superfamily
MGGAGVSLPQPIHAVTVDLDDTLYPQSAFLSRAWAAVAAAGVGHGMPEERLFDALMAECALGSDRGGIIDWAVAVVGGSHDVVPELVETFRSFTPYQLAPYPGAAPALAELRELMPIACVTDGDPDIQRAKLRALRLEDAFDAIVISDEMGRGFRKPHPAPFLRALELLGVPGSAAIHVGDRPEKDVAGPAAADMAGAVRVRQGEYADVIDGPGGPAPLATVFAVGDALRLIKDAARHTPAAPFTEELATGLRAQGDATTPHSAERTALVAGAGASHAAADLRSHERHAFPQEARRRVAQVEPEEGDGPFGAEG